MKSPDEAIQRLWDELVLLRDAWNQFNALYRGSSEVAVLLDRSARWFFRTHADMLSRDIVLRISRLTDRELTKSQRNLVLASILRDAHIDEYPGLRDELESELAELCSRAKPIRYRRHKYLAHLDHAAATGTAPPAPPVRWEDVAALIEAAERIYHRYRCHVYESDVDFNLHTLGGPTDLIRALQDGENWRMQTIASLRKDLKGPLDGGHAA